MNNICEFLKTGECQECNYVDRLFLVWSAVYQQPYADIVCKSLNEGIVTRS